MNANENSHEYLEQLSLFDDILTDYVITKPVRLISFFSGIEAQFKALSVLGHYLNMPIESYKTCEWAYNSIIACNSIHNKDFYPYANHLTKEQIIEKIKGISVNYNEPLSDEQLSKKPLKWLQNAYNNCVANHNLLNIMNVHAEDLEIVDTHRYDYILTYSFPCQDLSLAGKRAGMDTSQADGGTRSGLLWEVERILTECQQINSLPQILIMENVPQIHSEKDYPNFEKWMLRLEELGYNSYWADLNSKDFGIPQNRERTFMVSILGKEYNYKFPLPIPRKYNLEDFLEKDKIDEKYYLSQAMVDYLTGINQKKSKYDRGDVFKRNLDPSKEIAATITTAAGQRATDNFIIDDNIKVVGNYSPSGHNASRVIDPTGLAPTVMENHGTVTAVAIRENTADGYREAHEGDGINISSRMQHQRGNVQYGLSQTLKTSIEVGTLEINGNNFRIRKLTPKECGRLMGFQDKDTDDMFQVGLTNAALYHCYGDSIVVTVLIGIIGKLYGLNPIEIKEVIYKYIESIKGE